MQSFKPGDDVTGKSKLLLRKRGRVIDVITDSHQKKYRVAWSDSTSGVIFGRSLQKCLPLEAPGPSIGPTSIAYRLLYPTVKMIIAVKSMKIPIMVMILM
jgi:hypothetical protein